MSGKKVQGLFNSTDGTSLYYQVEGEGPVLVFCYGLLCMRDHWRHQIEHFGSRYQIVTFDYRGHHSSARPENDKHMTLGWCAKDVGDLLEHLGITDAVVLGHSMGVPVLTQFLASESERIRGAVFVCGAVTNPFSNMFHSSRMEKLYQAASALYDQAPGLVSSLWKKFTEKNRLNFFMTSRLGFNASRAEERDVLMYMEGVSRMPFSVFHSLMTDYTQFDGRDLLPKIQCPVLVIAGEDDHVTPITLQEEIAGLLHKGKIFRVVEGSHNAHMDFPSEVNEALEEFLKEIRF